MADSAASSADVSADDDEEVKVAVREVEALAREESAEALERTSTPSPINAEEPDLLEQFKRQASLAYSEQVQRRRAESQQATLNRAASDSSVARASKAKQSQAMTSPAKHQARP